MSRKINVLFFFEGKEKCTLQMCREIRTYELSHRRPSLLIVIPRHYRYLAELNHKSTTKHLELNNIDENRMSNSHLFGSNFVISYSTGGPLWSFLVKSSPFDFVGRI